MSTSSDENTIDAMTRMIQLIAGSLIMGVVFFLGIVTVIAPMVAAGRPPVAAAGPRAAHGQDAGANAAPEPATGSMELAEIITWVAVAFAAIGLPLSFVLPGQIASGIRRSIAAGTWTAPAAPTVQRGPFSPDALHSDAGKLALVYQTQFVIGAAINEGLAFFAAAAYLLGRSPIALGLAVVLIGALIVRFPTRLRVASWIERQQELLVQDRQAAS